MMHIRSLSRLVLATSVGACVGVVLAQPAAAHPRHHHYRHITSGHPPFSPPLDHPDQQRAQGFFGGYMETGMFGATTADPYGDPGYSRSRYGLPPIPQHY